MEIDWNVYLSIDRNIVSGPIAVENIHDFWNDYGIQLYLESRLFNTVVYVTNSFGYQAGYDATGSFFG